MGTTSLALLALLSCTPSEKDSGSADLGSVPTVSLTSPEDGSTWTEGEPILFSADVETDASGVLLSWSSDLDGEFSNVPAEEDGVAQFTFATLSAGTHVLTVLATDEHHLTGEGTVSFTVAP